MRMTIISKVMTVKTVLSACNRARMNSIIE